MIQFVHDVHSYGSRPFDIVCERQSAYGGFQMTVINNSTKEAVEIVKDIHQNLLSSTRDELIMKYLLILGE